MVSEEAEREAEIARRRNEARARRGEAQVARAALEVASPLSTPRKGRGDAAEGEGSSAGAGIRGGVGARTAAVAAAGSRVGAGVGAHPEGDDLPSDNPRSMRQLPGGARNLKGGKARHPIDHDVLIGAAPVLTRGKDKVTLTLNFIITVP